jgi:hypothetical protein
MFWVLEKFFLSYGFRRKKWKNNMYIHTCVGYFDTEISFAEIKCHNIGFQ